MDDGAAYASSPSPTRAAREPFRADGVEEHFLDGRASTTTSMVEALSRSLSVVVLANVATVAEHGDRPEVYALRTRAIVVSTAEFAEREKLRASGLLDEMMAGDQHDPDRVRMPIAETCSAEDQAICDRLLVRAVARLRLVSQLVRPAVVSFLDVMLYHQDGVVRFAEVEVGPQAVGKTLGELEGERSRAAAVGCGPADGRTARACLFCGDVGQQGVPRPFSNPLLDCGTHHELAHVTSAKATLLKAKSAVHSGFESALDSP